jgi:hypothetical protein
MARLAGLVREIERWEAKRLWLELEGMGDRVHLCIRDDGVGFDPVAAPSWSATATSAWWRCASASRWPVAASSSSRVRGPGWW